MTEQEFLKQLEAINEEFAEKVQRPLVKLVREYLESNNGEVSWYDLSYKQQIRDIEDLPLTMAWVVDRLEGRDLNIDNNKNYRGSLTKKFRKNLGYTCP